MKKKSVFILMTMVLTSTIALTSFLSWMILPNKPLNDVNILPNSAKLYHNQQNQSYSQQWLINPTLSSPIEPTWYSAVDGDLTDIDALDGQGQANVTVIGDSGTMSIVESKDNWNASNWFLASHPDFPVIPNNDHNVYTGGAYASHTWDEDTDQTGNAPCGLYKRQVTMGVDMNDYTVTSAYLFATANATVGADVDAPGDSLPNFDVGDYVRYSVELSDLSGLKKYEVAWNKTRDLGAPGTLTMSDTLLVNVSQPALIFFLESVLGTDGYNFNITLSIRIYSEDNDPTYDEDTYTDLWITTFNLTFTYAKKVNQLTSASWSQQGNELPQGNVVVDSARLHFKYRCDQDWASTVNSPNSEIRMQINNITHSETVKLTTANSSLQDGKVGGFDITTIIPKSNNITVTIQVYLADNFNLANNVTISIDDAYLWINYTIFIPEPPQPIYLDAVANKTRLYTNQWTQITITCENRSAENVSRLWYNDPFTANNVTLATDFTGFQTYYIINTSAVASPYTFKFWANSSEGVSYDEVIVLWVAPEPPILNVIANPTNLYINEWTQLTVTCQNGSGNVSRLWYNDPFTANDVTLATKFTGIQTHYLNFTSAVAGPYTFKFWANSSEGETYREIIVLWDAPDPPFLNVEANTTQLYLNFWTQLTVTCQNGTGNVDRLWYYNPLDGQNHTLATDFTGNQTIYLNFTSPDADLFKFQFWANSSLGLETDEHISISWITPQERGYMWLFWLLAALIAGLASLFLLYQVYFRVPRLIRMIRKTKKNISKGKPTEPLDVNKRAALVDDIHKIHIKSEEKRLQKYIPLIKKI